MIFEAVIRMFTALFSAVGSMFGTLTMPGWWADLDGMLSDLAGWCSGMGAWVPFDNMIRAANFVVTAVLLAFVIKVIRMLVSVFTGGGGSAG